MTDQSPPLVTVYVVVQAEYEANGPVAVFTNEAAATEHAKNLRAGGYTDYEVEPMSLLGVVPQRTKLHLCLGFVNHDDGRVEKEQAWTTDHWDYELPREPVVTIGRGWVDVTRVHVAAATPEAAEAAFREAVEKVREAL